MTLITHRWHQIIPFLGVAALALTPVGILTIVMAAILVAVVIAAVHHAEVIAHKVGEPFGSLVLALAVTVIEAGLIVTLMLAGGAEASGLARDTVFAAAMIIMGLIVGLSLLVGAIHHNEQDFTRSGAVAALATLAVLLVLTMVLPNYTVTAPGPSYSPVQLGFVALLSLFLYATFLFVQTVRHRDYFLPKNVGPEDDNPDDDLHAPPPSGRTALLSLGLLIVCLVAVVLLAKSLSPVIEGSVAAAGLPQAVVGVVIAGVVLMPEGLAALRAAMADRLQTSLNLALGSSLATIGLTIPAVAAVSLFSGLPLTLGLSGKEIVLAALMFYVAALSLLRGRTTILQGALHLVVFAAYLLVTLVP